MNIRSAAALIAAAIGLSACADLGLDAPWQEPRPVVSAPQIGVPEPRPAKTDVPRPAAKPADKKAAAVKPAAPEPEPRAAPKLVGLSEAETAQLLGRPTEEAEQPPGKVWTYKATGCRLSVHLFPDMEKGGFYTLDTTAEEGSREQCLVRLATEARKKD